jgi:hypothetical protein
VIRALLLVAACMGFLAGQEDAAIQAARRALSAGEAEQARLLLADHPARLERNAVRLLWARSLLLAGAIEPASQAVDAGLRLPEWPAPLRGGVLQIAGECDAALADDAASRVAAAKRLAVAMDIGGPEVAVDRCLLLVAQLLADERPTVAIRACERLWHGRRDGRARIEAGLLLARLVQGAEPDRSRRLLTDLLALPQVDADLRRAAGHHLCALLLERSPTACARVAARLRRDALSDFARWEALARARFDSEGARAILALLDPDQDDAALAALRSRLNKPDGGAGDGLAGLLATARSGDKASREQLRALAQDDPAAYVLAVCYVPLAMPIQRPETDLAALAAAQVAIEQEADVAVVLGLLQRWEPRPEHRDWQRVSAIAPGLTERLLYRACRAIQADSSLWHHTLLASSGSDQVLGEAWVWAARRQEARGQAAGSAWLAAAERLPVGHPWLFAVVKEAAKGLLRAVPPGTRVAGGAADPDLSQAVRVLSRVSWFDESEDAQACRWLLAQALAQQGDAEGAEVCLASLEDSAGSGRIARLQAFRERLAEAKHTHGLQVTP